MSGWQTVVDTIYQAGPKTLAQLEWLVAGERMPVSMRVLEAA